MRPEPNRDKHRIQKHRVQTIAVALCSVLFAGLTAMSCFESGSRYLDVSAAITNECATGSVTCTSVLRRCVPGPTGSHWETVDDCAGKGQVCAPDLLACTDCLPNENVCDGLDVLKCGSDGFSTTYVETCDAATGKACRNGSCADLCALAEIDRSNVGCEYWAVDLDNARINATSNAAAQQFAVVVSNPQPDVPVSVHIFQDDTLPGEDNDPTEIAAAVIAPLNLQVFKLGPREVDGSPPGTFNEGTHTALSRAAFKIVTDFPVVAYQFNPLENANVFSNDASLLKPREALSYGSTGMRRHYVVVGWPQTIAITDDPSTNFNPNDPIHLRAALTLVGTTEATSVRVHTTAAVVGGGPVAETAAGGVIEAVLGPYDVLNLETGDFGADFTGSIIEADGPIAVFSGGEASDAPHFETLADRRCCADHLEDQLVPIRTAGKVYAIAHSPSRTRAIDRAGAGLTPVPEPDFVRFVAATDEGAEITTTLPPPNDLIVLSGAGDWHEVTATRDFMAVSDHPVVVAQIMASQAAAGVPSELPGGDPSMMIVPPLEQARPDYVFLTPDKYAFDFVSIVAPATATILLDDTPIDADLCEVAAADGLTAEERGPEPPSHYVYRCQLSFPTIDPSADPIALLPGLQDDGVHRIVSDYPVSVTVTGFDAFVSYAYAAGTELRELGPPL